MISYVCSRSDFFEKKFYEITTLQRLKANKEKVKSIVTCDDVKTVWITNKVLLIFNVFRNEVLKYL